MPKFKVTQHIDSGLLGTVSCETVEIQGEPRAWVSDGALVFLVCDRQVYEGHWHRDGVDWIFAPRESTGEIPADSVEFSVFDAYWGKRVQLVFEESLSWEKQTWTTDGHDHCAICWESINALPGSAEHFAADGNDGIRFHSSERSCVKCYDEYISRNDTSFVPAYNPID